MSDFTYGGKTPFLAEPESNLKQHIAKVEADRDAAYRVYSAAHYAHLGALDAVSAARATLREAEFRLDSLEARLDDLRAVSG